MPEEGSEHRPTEKQPEESTPAEETEVWGSKEAGEQGGRGVFFFAQIIHFIGQGWQAVRQSVRGDGHSPIDDLRAAFGHLNPWRIILALVGLVMILVGNIWRSARRGRWR